jgi:hypothetical protein
MPEKQTPVIGADGKAMVMDKAGKPITNAVAIKTYFGGKGDKPITTSEFMTEYKELSTEEQATLGEGIRNGTLNY